METLIGAFFGECLIPPAEQSVILATRTDADVSFPYDGRSITTADQAE